jgi:hypothetical protein
MKERRWCSPASPPLNPRILDPSDPFYRPLLHLSLSLKLKDLPDQFFPSLKEGGR